LKFFIWMYGTSTRYCALNEVEMVICVVTTNSQSNHDYKYFTNDYNTGLRLVLPEDEHRWTPTVTLILHEATWMTWIPWINLNRCASAIPARLARLTSSSSGSTSLIWVWALLYVWLWNFENVSDRSALQKVSKFYELLSAGDKTIWWTIATVIDSMTRAVLAVSISTVNLRKNNINQRGQGLSNYIMMVCRTVGDEQTIIVRGAPDAGSSCLQLVYHTLSKIVNSHIMDENCLLHGTANGNSKLWILIFWLKRNL
jgi:hypothetical protein